MHRSQMFAFKSLVTFNSDLCSYFVYVYRGSLLAEQGQAGVYMCVYVYSYLNREKKKRNYYSQVFV